MIKIKLSILLVLSTMRVFSQTENTVDGRIGNLDIKIYGGISPLLSSEVKATTPFQTFFNFDYEDDPGYNLGINVGFFLTNKIALHVGFERKDNRIFLTNFPGPTGFPIRSKTSLNSNTVYLSSNYYFFLERNFDPYIGIGGALLQQSNYDFIGADYEGSGEIGLRGVLGFNYNFNSRWALNFELNYTAFSDIGLEDSSMTIFEVEYNPLTINLGLIYTLNFSKENN